MLSAFTSFASVNKGEKRFLKIENTVQLTVFENPFV